MQSCPLRRIWALITWLPTDSAWHVSAADAAAQATPPPPAKGMTIAGFAKKHGQFIDTA